MSRVLRLSSTVAVLAAALAAGCSSGGSSSSSTPATGGTLTVLGADTLDTPFTAAIQAFEKLNPGVTVHSQFGASADMIRDVTQVGQKADVLGTADYSLIPELMSTRSKPHATWYLGFAANEITFAYTSRSKGARQVTAANWYKVLAQPGVRIGRSNPAADPSGYQVLEMLQLAQSYYHDPGLAAAVLKNSPDSSAAETQTSLLAALRSGKIDYLAIDRSSALEDHLEYISLPPQINLSDSSEAAAYGKVTINAGSLGKLTAKPIIYGLTIPSNAPDPALAQKFISFLLNSDGAAIMGADGFSVFTPALASGTTPASLQSLTTRWPASG